MAVLVVKDGDYVTPSKWVPFYENAEPVTGGIETFTVLSSVVEKFLGGTTAFSEYDYYILSNDDSDVSLLGIDGNFDGMPDYYMSGAVDEFSNQYP